MSHPHLCQMSEIEFKKAKRSPQKTCFSVSSQRYPAGREKKKAPNYLNSLRDGHIDMDELLTFVFQASARAETKIHVASRRSTLGERALREGLQYLTFEESLNVYEPNLEALDLDQIRRSVRGESLGSKGEL